MATRRQDDPPRSPSSPLTPEAMHELSSTLYQELHRLAVGKMRFERGNHTLQPTALVNEAYLRLVDRLRFDVGGSEPRVGACCQCNASHPGRSCPGP